MNTELDRIIFSVVIRDQQVFLVHTHPGFLLENGRLKTFSTIEDAKKLCSGNSRIWPEEGPVDLEFARNWISNSAKPATLEVLNRLNDVDTVFLGIVLAYSDFNPEDLSPDVKNEYLRSYEATLSWKRDSLSKLSILIAQQDMIKISKEQGWDTERLIQGWGGERKNEWTQDELDQLGTELAVEIDFIENTLQRKCV